MYDDYEETDIHYISERKYGKPLGHNAPHYPNKSERRELIRLMQKSGHTEEEVRSDLNNRRKLAAAAKEPCASNFANRWRRYQLLVKRCKRNIAASLGVPVWDVAVEASMHEKNWYGVTQYDRIHRSVFK